MSSGCSVRSAVTPRPERDREHHGARREHAAPAFGSNLGLAQRRMTESDEVSDLVRRDRLQIEAPGAPRPPPWTT